VGPMHHTFLIPYSEATFVLDDFDVFKLNLELISKQQYHRNCGAG